MVLDGEPLTADEQRELLAQSDGLRLLRGKWVEVDQKQLQQALDHWNGCNETMREESASSKECGSWRALIWGKRARPARTKPVGRA